MKGENTGAGADTEGQANATGGGEAEAPASTDADATHFETTSVRTENGAIVVTGRLFRHGGGNGRPHRFSGQPAPSAPPPTRRPARVAQMLAFAHRVEAEVTRGDFESRSAAARHYGMTTGRIARCSFATPRERSHRDQVVLVHDRRCYPLHKYTAAPWLFSERRYAKKYIIGMHS
ncbi:hypothetical protein [Haliangium ochraceum]|uniref:hypothetical protein n=1 Tax=Haliangium ochraceum TaxID=80816 RepID=UPI00019BA34E|nr:hypothetical protein [Haliangium ochraceum]